MMTHPEPGTTVALLVLAFIHDIWVWYVNSNGVFEEKELFAWSLISHEWSASLRPLCFERVDVRSREHAQAFFALLNSSEAAGTRFGQHIQSMKLEDSLVGDAWFPAVLSARSNLPNCKQLHLVIRRPASYKKLLPFYPSLPRLLPQSHVQFMYVYMGKCRLPSFDDLLAFCGAACDFGTLNSNELSCDDWDDIEQGSRPPQLAIENRAIPQEIFIRHCKKRWLFLWLLLTTSRQAAHNPWTKNRARYIDSQELPKLESLARCVMHSCGDKCLNHNLELDDQIDEIVTRLRMFCETSMGSPVIEVSISSATGRVTGVRLVCEQWVEKDGELSLLITELQSSVQYRWEDLDECLSAFGEDMTEFSVQVRTDESNMRRFAESIVPRMSRVREIGKLQLFYAEPLEGYHWDDNLSRDFWRFEWTRLGL